MDEFLLNEPVVTALADRLAAELPGALQTIRARLAATKEPVEAEMMTEILEDPAQVLDYPPLASELAAGMPCVGIIDAPSRILDDTGSSATGEHRLGIVVYLASYDQRQLAWGLRRYAQAIAKVALRGRRLGTTSEDGAWGTVARGTSPGDTLEHAEDPRQHLSWIVVWIEARRDELP